MRSMGAPNLQWHASAMTIKTLALPILELSEKRDDSHVALQCSVTLDIPPEVDWIASAVDLKRAVDDKQLWIAKKEASFVNLSVANSWQGLTADNLETLEHQIKDFEAIAGRVSAMSVISTSLARMVDAESPEVRRKTRAFGGARNNDGIASRPMDKVRHSIQEGAWATLLRHTKRSVPKRSPGRNRSTQPAIDFNKDVANGALCRPSQLTDSLTWSQSDIAPEMSHTTFMSFNNSLPVARTRQPTLWMAEILE
ncbi:uncharacterized protein J7T54_007227 [Emericellopsis cladophorae]|uniref:Uncharacterized protein n=1 Tax=Emericellopsis cladophorae TaxID=2686198 RepID=A0A9P9XZI6_9HYPO|nr:uncharacterized protein J7T54_007227 [Emericellopsis cladophorae]KAI6780378.1 hypothetical protein J7T54_007227 [Emericellopsis cladophorae]